MDVWLDEDGMLHGRSKVVAGEDYVVTIYDPEKQESYETIIHPIRTGEMDWQE